MGKKNKKQILSTGVKVKEDQSRDDAVSEAIDKAIDKIEDKLDLKSIHLTRSGKVEGAISTGIQPVDLIIGGGFMPGRISSVIGLEASCKSTICLSTICSAMVQYSKTHMLYHDAESAVDVPYLINIAKQFGIDDITDLFGDMDSKGKWIKKRRIRLYNPTNGEECFELMKLTLNKFPNRRVFFEKGKRVWFDIYDDGEEVESSCDPQMIHFLDSTAALIPEDLDKEDASNEAMAERARMFSRLLPKVISRFKKKNSTFIFVNQLRKKPAAMFENPIYEPGGETLKYALSGVRISLTSVSFSNKEAKIPFTNDGKGIHIEPSVTGDGVDKYKLVKVYTPKCKVFTPYQTTFFRVWFDSAEGCGHGICPVYATYKYLEQTGQITNLMRGKGFLLNFSGIEKKFKNWLEFKKYILCKKGGKALRKATFDQLKTNKAYKLYFKHKNS